MELLTYGHYRDSFLQALTESGPYEESKLAYDSRHTLVSQLDGLISALRLDPRLVLRERLSALLVDLREHIIVENNCMEAVGYPETGQHRFHHLFIAGSLRELHRRACLQLQITPEELSYFRVLLLGHIHLHDEVLEQYLTIGAQGQASPDGSTPSEANT